ncbi:hypothetical protein CANINC_000052 [Pichia inconspicua]|uniref:Uncharacterized protein n=1 Tax=Pichia inconspicua TaxID=52247 RepID=A0A4T0X732_9ASCO|nr:hypothetical protein CANINC_000052 [[Candida] inconspicua]
MRFSLPLLALIAGVFAQTTVFTTTTTTTRDPAAAATEAAAEQQQFLLTVILDAFKNAGRYQSVMEQEGMALPPELIQFVAELKVQDSDHGFPTSLFANRFPFTQFATFVEKFTWVSTYYDPGMTTFKVPSEFATQVIEEVITSTIDGSESSTTAVSFQPSNVSSTATVATVTSSNYISSSVPSETSKVSSTHASTSTTNSSSTPSPSSTANGAMQYGANALGAAFVAAIALI